MSYLWMPLKCLQSFSAPQFQEGYNLQGGQTLQRVPSLQQDQVVQLFRALQKDQRDQDHHEDHEVHPYQRDQRGQGVQQYPKRGREGIRGHVKSVCMFEVITKR